MREERKIFCIQIIDRKALLVIYILRSTVAFLMLRESVRNLLQVIFCGFFFDILFILFFIFIFREGNHL
jgi:hypothetical protein